jgi:hypothetical protein
MRKGWRAILGLAAILAAAGGGCAGPKLVARVDGEPITQEELYQALRSLPMGATPAGSLVLQNLITETVLEKKAAKEGVKVTEEDIKKRLEQVKEQALSTGLSWEESLQQSFTSQAEIEKQIRRNLLLARMVITDKERKQFFQEHKKELAKYPSVQEAVLVRRIVAPKKSELEAIRKEISEGRATFAKMAREKSQDPISRERGGISPWIYKGQLSPQYAEFERAAFSLEEGGMSQPLEIKPPAPQKGEKLLPPRYELILVEKKRPARPATLENLEDQINWQLLREKAFEVEEFTQDLLAEAQVEILDPFYSPLGEQLKRAREEKAKRARPETVLKEMVVPAKPEAAEKKKQESRPTKGK